MRRFHYEDAEKPWEPDSILKKQIPRLAALAPFDFAQGKQGRRDDKPRALDLGMGYGRNAIWLAERGCLVEGWEKDGRYVREAREEAKRRGVGLTIRRGDFAKGGWRGPYEVIVISQALHQVKRSAALRVLKGAKRALAPGGKLLLIAKLTSDRHVQRARGNPAWKRMKGERNTWLRPEARKRGSYHPGRPRPPAMVLSALEPREIRRALEGLKLRHWRTVVLRSDWEEEHPVTHTVAEVVAEKRK